MSNLVKLGTISEMPSPNEAKEFECANRTICVANVSGELSAMDNECRHSGGPLGQGVIEGGKLICPWHGWAWDPKTGAAHVPGVKVEVYPVKVENGGVWIEL
jgi:nitrite reductase (NADH) small subunit